jgi:hypothetical protein
METTFTKGMEYLNNLINKVEKGSEAYKLLCLAKYRYVQDF